MTSRTVASLVALALAVSTGCGPTAQPSSEGKAKPPAHDHPTTGPSGGAIVEWGEEDYHLEFVADRAAGEATVYVLDKTAKKVTAIPSKSLTLSLDGSPPATVILTPKPQDGDPAGQSSRFVGKNEALKKDGAFRGSVSGEVEGKRYTGDFKEKPPRKK